MANNDINITITSKMVGVTEAVAASKKLEKNVDSLVRAQEKGNITAKQASAGIQELRRNYVAYAGSVQKSVAVIDKVEKAVRKNTEQEKRSKDEKEKLVAVDNKLKATTKAYAQARKAANAENQRYNATLKGYLADADRATAATARHDKETRRLTLAYKSGYVAFDQARSSLRDLREAHRRGIITTEQHSAAVERLKIEYAEFKAGTAGWSNQFVTGGKRAGKAMNRFGMYAQQVGYQVGDFFVQVQSGQNVMVAFAQQGTQLAGLLPGLAGAVVGIGLSLAGLVYQMYRAKTAGDDAGDSVKSWADKVKEAEDETANLADEVERLSKGFESVSKATLTTNVSNAQAAVDAFLAKNPNGSMAGARAGGTVAYEQSLGTLKEALEAAKAALTEFDEASGNKSALEARKAAMEASMQAIAEGEELIKNSNKAAKEQLRLKHQEISLLRIQVQFGKDSAAAKELQKQHALENFRLSLEQEGVDKAIVSALIDATSWASSLANQLGRGATNAAAILSNLPGGHLQEGTLSFGKMFDKQNYDPTTGKFTSTSGVTPFQNMFGLGRSPSDIVKPNMGGGGGGGGSAKAEKDSLDVLRERIKLQEKQLFLTQEQKTVADAAAKSNLAYTQQELVVMAEKLAGLNKLQTVYESFNSTLEDGLMAMVDGTKSVKDAFRDMAADIIKELYRVYVVQRLTNMVSGSVFGGGFGSFMSGFGKLASGGTMMAGQSYLVGERGPELVTPRHSGTVVNANQTANAMSGGGGTSEVIVSLSPELIGQVLAASANQSVQIVSTNNKAARKSFRGQISNTQTRGTS